MKMKKQISLYFNFKQNIIRCYSLHTGIEQPDMTRGNRVYKVYSPETFKLRPRDDIHLDL